MSWLRRSGDALLLRADKATLELFDGTHLPAKVVIGADGVHSRVRGPALPYPFSALPYPALPCVTLPYPIMLSMPSSLLPPLLPYSCCLFRFLLPFPWAAHPVLLGGLLTCMSST